jgi:hypothetical protein
VWEDNVSPCGNPVGEIGSRYSTYVYDCNRFSLPKLRQKMVQSCGMMFINLPDGCCYGDRNTWNTFPVSKQKIILNNQTMNNQMKQSEQKQEQIQSDQQNE